MRDCPSDNVITPVYKHKFGTFKLPLYEGTSEQVKHGGKIH
jgi:hypothetical protein